MIKITIILLACVTTFSGCKNNSKWANYHRVLQKKETVLIGDIVYQKSVCHIEQQISCYNIILKNGTQYPLIFYPVVPNKVFSGKYDITGHFLKISDSRYEKAFSVRL